MHIEGFLPVIINVTPVNIPLLLGLVDEEHQEPATDPRNYSHDPAIHKNRFDSSDPEQVSLLN